MATIGEQWRQAQDVAARRNQEDESSAREQRALREAEVIIRTLQEKISSDLSAPSHLAFGHVTFEDVAGTDKDKVDQLYLRLLKESRTLSSGDLAGRAKIVFEWCERNDLECFLVSVRILMNDFEYNFHVRPKRPETFPCPR
ncbi:MAG TPA: hypothetical protein VFQ60_05665 [Patescibacteria group bacterium]|nr:hypothetical protein [Patescibacteria group bacterium]